MKVRLDQPWGHIALAGLVHDLLVNCQVNCVSPFGNGTMPNYDKVGYGFNLTGHLNTWGKDTLKGGVFVGKGIDHYIGDSAQPRHPDRYRPAMRRRRSHGWCPGAYVPVEWGIYAAYQHFWTDALRSTLGAGYNHVSIDRNLFVNSPTSGVVLGNVFQTTHWSIAANLVWSPVPKVDLGVEYIYYHVNFASEGLGDWQPPVTTTASKRNRSSTSSSVARKSVT